MEDRTQHHQFTLPSGKTIVVREFDVATEERILESIAAFASDGGGNAAEAFKMQTQLQREFGLVRLGRRRVGVDCSVGEAFASMSAPERMLVDRAIKSVNEPNDAEVSAFFASRQFVKQKETTTE